MENSKVEIWLNARGIKLQENFSVALKNLAEAFKNEHEIKNVETVYSLIGVRKQYLSYWMKHSNSSQQKIFKQRIALKAGNIFNLIMK